jgi:hypothetical protein
MNDNPMNTVLAVSMSKQETYCDKLDAFVKRHWKGFVAGFSTLAFWNFLRWFI